MVVLFAFETRKQEGRYYFLPWRYDSVYADVAIPTFLYDSELQSYCAFIHLIEYCHKAQLTYVSSAQYAQPSALASQKC